MIEILNDEFEALVRDSERLRILVRMASVPKAYIPAEQILTIANKPIEEVKTNDTL